MTELLYMSDSYLQEFTAVVLETDTETGGVILDRTAFYPGGGGQPCDNGHLRFGSKDAYVSKVKKKDDKIIHILDSGILPAPGSEITGKIDWERRYRLMRTHTAMHILSAVAWRDYSAQVTGGNMEPGNARMDFEFEGLTGEMVKEIEKKINEEVERDYPVEVKILPREEAMTIPDLIRTKINLLPEGIEEIRTVNIVGLDLQADGGTHVASTSEVGRIRIKDYKSKGKINKRLYIELDL